MRHPTDGTLRRLLDEPSGVADTDRVHIASCPACQAGLAAARADAEEVGAMLYADISDIDVEAAWRRLSAAASIGVASADLASAGPASADLASAGPAFPGPGAAGAAADGASGAAVLVFPPPGQRRKTRRWGALRSPVIAGAAVAALLAGAGAAAAANWLPIFKTERVAPITIVPSDLVQLPELSGYGSLQVQSAPRLRTVGGAAEATAATGLPVPRVAELPRGVTGEPAYRVGDRAAATFTFSAAKAAQTAAAEGRTLPPMPPGLDGSQFRLSAGPGIAAVWSEARGVPALIVARAAAPAAFSGGVPFETARDYLLSLPGLPPSVASQLRAFAGEGTLPLIVKAGKQTSYLADVGGAQATVLATQDQTMAAVVWVERGMVTGVAGSLSPAELLGVARGLTWRK